MLNTLFGFKVPAGRKKGMRRRGRGHRAAVATGVMRVSFKKAPDLGGRLRPGARPDATGIARRMPASGPPA